MKKSNSALVSVIAVLAASVASADVLFYDGFVVGEGGYTTTSVNGYAGDACRSSFGDRSVRSVFDSSRRSLDCEIDLGEKQT